MYNIRIFIIMCIFISCNKDKVIESDNNIGLLFGKWSWVKSETQWPVYILETPQLVGYTHYLEFTDDRSVKVFYADTLQKICAYEIENSSVTFCNNMYRFEIRSDTLILSQAYIDGPTVYYKKL